LQIPNQAILKDNCIKTQTYHTSVIRDFSRVTATARPIYIPEVAGVTFSDSDFAPVLKFLNPDPEIFQIWESDSGCYRSNRN